MQIAPIEWGWKKIEKFFSCTLIKLVLQFCKELKMMIYQSQSIVEEKKPFDFKTAELIRNFYIDDAISRQSSYTKDTRISKELGTIVIQYMMLFIGEAFELFKTKYHGIKVSRRSSIR